MSEEPRFRPPLREEPQCYRFGPIRIWRSKKRPDMSELEVEQCQDTLMGRRLRFGLGRAPTVIQGTVVRVIGVPGRADLVQIVLDNPESQPYTLVATKEYIDRTNESKREPIDPRKIDIVPVLIGVGLLAAQVAFVVAH